MDNTRSDLIASVTYTTDPTHPTHPVTPPTFQQTTTYKHCGCSVSGVAPLPVDCPTHGAITQKSKAKICLAIVLDESGSMGHVRQKTIEGLNEYLNGLRSDPNADYLVTITKFDSHPGEPNCRIIASMVELRYLASLTPELYTPRGMTPWYDALGETITHMEQRAHGRPVLLVSVSDGAENSSKEYTLDRIKERIRSKEMGGNWTFVYMGSDINAAMATAGTGIKTGNMMSFQSQNIDSMLANNLYAATAAYSMTRSAMPEHASYAQGFFEIPDQNAKGLAGTVTSTPCDPLTGSVTYSDLASLGGKARAAKMTPEERSASARKASHARRKKPEVE